MLPGETIAVIIDTDLPAEEIRNRITIKTLRDTY
jgi:hypothetical protein